MRNPLVLMLAGTCLIILMAIFSSRAPLALATTLHSTTAPTSKPGPNNTGPTGPLHASGSITCTQPDEVIEGVDVTGIIEVKALNVTIRNFRIDGQGENYDVRVYPGASVTLEDGELTDAGEAAIYGNNWTARRLNIHHMLADGTKGGGDNTLEYCWLHHLGMKKGTHADGLQLDNGSHFVIRHNNFDLPWRTEEGDKLFSVNSCFFIDGWVHNGNLDDVLIEDNWLDGGNYMIYAKRQTNTRVLNNRIGHDTQYGLLSGKVAEWFGNTWIDTGDPAAAPISKQKAGSGPDQTPIPNPPQKATPIPHPRLQ